MNGALAAGSRASSVHEAAAIDDEGLAGDERALVRREEDHCPHQIVRELQARQGPPLNRREPHPDRFVGGVLLAECAAGSDRVYCDPAGSYFAGERAREPEAT